jgi:hypothetical protein
MICDNHTCGGNEYYDPNKTWPIKPEDEDGAKTNATTPPIPGGIIPPMSNQEVMTYVFMGTTVALLVLFICYCIYNNRKQKRGVVFEDRSSVFEEPVILNQDLVNSLVPSNYKESVGSA